MIKTHFVSVVPKHVVGVHMLAENLQYVMGSVFVEIESRYLRSRVWIVVRPTEND